MTGRLVYRIAVPVILTILVMGMALYAFNLRLISDFSKRQINESMSRLSHETYDICDRDFTELLQQGLLGDEKAIRIVKASTLGAIEDFLRKNNIDGQIFDQDEAELLQSKIPSEYLKESSGSPKQPGVRLLRYENKEYYATQTQFEPWEWRIVIFKDASDFSALTRGVRIGYIITGIILLFSGILLLFSIHKTVTLPIEQIIDDVRVGRSPEYQGTSELEFLSATINQMMKTVEEREQTIKDSERRLADIINFLPDATLAVDRQGKVIAWNRAIEEMTGVRAEAMIVKNDYEYAIPFYGTRRPILVDLVFSPEEDIRKKYPDVSKQGECLLAEADVFLKGRMRTVWAIASPLYDDSGNIEGAIESIRDVTERKQAEAELKKYQEHLEDLVKERAAELMKTNVRLTEEIAERKEIETALRESETRYHRITDAVTDYIYTVQLENGRVLETRHGPGCAAVTGYTEQEFALDPYLWIRMVADEDRNAVEEQARRVLAGEKVPAIEHRLTRKDAVQRWVRNTPVPRYDMNGVLLSYDGLIQDITDRKRAEETLEKLVYELREALAKVKQLSGFLPICASCKKIRDDKGYWNQIESYIREHSEAEFSHGLCPDCAKKLYPDYYKEKKDGT